MNKTEEAVANQAPLVYNALHSVWRSRIIGFGTAAIGAALVLLLAPPWLQSSARFVAAYDAAAVCLSASLWLTAMNRDSRHSAKRAAVSDPGKHAILSIILISALNGILAAVAVLGRGPGQVTPSEKHLAYTLAVTAMFAGWWLIHTVFTFRYAHMYYADGNDDCNSDRGLEFPGTKNPNDYDFAYFSFVIGMTFQVSDVDITDPNIRRVALFHAIISFLYNTAIFALGINIMSGLIH